MIYSFDGKKGTNLSYKSGMAFIFFTGMFFFFLLKLISVVTRLDLDVAFSVLSVLYIVFIFVICYFGMPIINKKG